MKNNVNIKNKKASYEFELIEKFTAGIQLVGTEIKSIRESKAEISSAFCQLVKGELFIKNMYISEYTFGNVNNHEPVRDRKLLLNKRELYKLSKKTTEKGLSIIPLRLFLSKRGFAKIEIAIGRGKKLHDKRESLKQNDAKRSIDRAMKD